MNGIQLPSVFELHVISFILSIAACRRADDPHLLELKEIGRFFFFLTLKPIPLFYKQVDGIQHLVVIERLGTAKSGVLFLLETSSLIEETKHTLKKCFIVFLYF